MAGSVCHAVIVRPTVRWESTLEHMHSRERTSLGLHVSAVVSAARFVQEVCSSLKTVRLMVTDLKDPQDLFKPL